MRRLILLPLLAAAAFADTTPALLLKPWAEGERAELSATVEAYLDGSTDAGADFGLRRYATEGRVKFGPAAAGYDVNFLEISTPDVRLPTRLVDLSIAAGSGFLKKGDWGFLALVGVGAAGDDPLSDSDAIYLRADLIAAKEIDANSHLVILIDFDGNRTVFPDVPVPAFVFHKKVSDTLEYALGIPYSSVVWKPRERWTIAADILVVALDARLRVTYDLTDAIHLFAAFETDTSGYHIDGGNPDRRLFFRQRHATLGVRWDAGPNVTVSFAGGYAFDRRFSTGWDSRELETVTEISAEVFFVLKGEFHF